MKVRMTVTGEGRKVADTSGGHKPLPVIASHTTSIAANDARPSQRSRRRVWPGTATVAAVTGSTPSGMPRRRSSRGFLALRFECFLAQQSDDGSLRVRELGGGGDERIARLRE